MANIPKKSTQTDKIPQPMYFDYLPDEILFKIFWDVPRIKFPLLTRVSPRIRRILEDKRYWRTVTVKEETISYYEFERMISGPWDFSELDLTAVKFRSSKVHHVNLHVSVDKLNISRVRPDRTNWKLSFFNPEFLEAAIVDACQPKYQLIMNGGVRFNRKLTNAIAERRELQVLSMEYAYLDVDQSNIHLLTTMFQNLRQLKELNIRLCRLDMHQWFMLCHHVSTTVEKMFLNHAVILHPYENTYRTGRREATDGQSLLTLVDRLENLRHLGVPCEYLAGPLIFNKLAELKYLEALHLCLCDLAWGETDALTKALHKLPNLKRVHFSNCPLLDVLTIESGRTNLENWSEEIPGRYTQISFTELECIIEFVSFKRLKTSIGSS